jgi:transcriptional regulator with XRE-family HTH domain
MPKRLKDVIKKARKSKGYSQSHLGKLIGNWGTYVGQIEKGDRTPSEKVCKKLATVLDLDLKELLILALKDRADIAESKRLLDVMYKLVTDPVVIELMGGQVQGANISNYTLVKELLGLSTHEKKVISDLVVRFTNKKK